MSDLIITHAHEVRGVAIAAAFERARQIVREHNYPEQWTERIVLEAINPEHTPFPTPRNRA